MMLQAIQITCDFKNIQFLIWRLWRTPVKQSLSRSLRFYLHLAEGWATVIAVLRFQYAVTYFPTTELAASPRLPSLPPS
jgi:hypothetical protein